MTAASTSPLPLPVAQQQRRRTAATRPLAHIPLLALLTQRARTTNLAVALLALTAALSLLVNLRLSIGNDVFRRPSDYAALVPSSIRATLQSPHSNLRHLVIVPGHAIWTGCDATHATQDTDWILEPMQRGGSVKTYLKHIIKGAEIAVRDPQALLIYSGGQTRPTSDLSEGQSYARLAKFGNLYQQFMSDDERRAVVASGGDFDRVTTEDFSLDSMENVLFSIARFKEFTGHYPTFITVVGYGMKRRRFTDVHRAAMRWPAGAWKYIGIDNEGDTAGDYDGERKYGLEPFLRDTYGCHGTLVAKRRKRNPYRRFHGYHSSAPELSRLLEYCPQSGTSLFSGPLPWD
ncbi:hypothetical protein Rhopal_005411-T1 [Rhodotorula paludigena]|uniref:Uncharacterized protein n=1 Tax=Rhodotorula paludigena TaxID=86838 RepID=A0AAV5GS92_9BASI|nr:hypothetical protein Rhopal_005411-T1 [Rhodotorula paludigena]